MNTDAETLQEIGMAVAFVMGMFLGWVLASITLTPSRSRKHVLRNAISERKAKVVADSPEAKILDDIAHDLRN